MITYIASMALASAIGLMLGYALGSKSDVPVKRTVGELNVDPLGALSRKCLELKTARNDAINLRAALIDIRNQGIASKSGTARSMALKAKDALK
jgi:hypothetical protein